MWKVLIASLMLMIPGSALFCQTTQESASADPPLAAHVVYGAFFRHVLALEDAAIEHDRAGRKGDEVRAYYQSAMKLTSSEAATVKRIAAECQDAVRELDLKAKKIIDASWAAYPNHRVPLGAKPPTVPDELRQLDMDRIATIEAHMQELETALGPAAFKKVDTHVRNVFAKQVSAVSAKPPTSSAGNEK